MPFARPQSWLTLLLLLLLLPFLVSAQLSTTFIEDTNTTLLLNLPASSQDVNLYISTPDFFSYTAIGLGPSMSTALLLIAYPSSDNRRVTLSPRRSTGHVEPSFDPSIQYTLHAPSGIHDHLMIINLTCHNCRSFINPSSSSQPLIFANGPGSPLSSDSLEAPLRRHITHGAFTVDLTKAAGSGGITLPQGEITDGVIPFGTAERTQNKAAVAHGIVLVIATLVVFPADALVASALRKWPVIHGVTALVLVGFVVGGLVPGVRVSGEHGATQKFQTGHQVVGLIAVSTLFLMFVWGIAVAFIRRGAAKRGQEPPQQTKLLGNVHRWVGRFIWVLLVVAGGLGLNLSQRSNLFMMGYGVLVGGVVVFTVPIWFCIWRCSKHQREKEEQEEMELQHNIYQHERLGY
ncbi:hypothetical protein OQA88_2243 [Cercophora sp. LCS_1]